ncbi:mucin-17-like isoform X2 [Homarus americanus]|uniref:mucin-17-like isoform X2 n=1 Tax=Homarus americanus TaxID=6706 RepID=UPI001C4588DC|nr:mucin-17-like isoform X2 [Homarus americanus]
MVEKDTVIPASVNAELKAALRRRRGDDSGSGDDDPGLPRSPPTSPTTLDVLNHGLKSCSRATQSTCSDGSLLSMGSSENDEDSLGAGSHHSSKVSLLEGRHQVVEPITVCFKDNLARLLRERPKKVPHRPGTRNSYVSDCVIHGRDPFLEDDENQSDNEPVVGAVRLSHQAAFHKISVRPRRTHGVPRSRRATQIGGQISLPDVIEEANSKNSASQKPLSIPTASPSLSTPHPESDNLEEPSSTSYESQAGLEQQDPEKKDKEEKRDGSLAQLFFGSKRSGRRQSRGSGDDSRENSVSPLRRGGDQRASREKRRDSSGSRFPLIGGASKTRQESHPLPPSGRPREPSKERVTKDVSTSSPQPLHTVSIEGAMETNLPGQPNFRISPYDERPSRPADGVRKVKSFREVPEQNATHREIVRRKVSSQTNVEDQRSVPSKMSRLSASLESLDGDELTRKSPAVHGTPSKILQTETSSSSQRSSTDSLTTTPLPGVFIRHESQSHNKTVLQKHQEHLQQLQQQQGAQEVNSGPYSLDSSIGLQSRESEDLLRKAASVDHVCCTLETQIQTREPETKESITPKAVEIKSTTEPKLNTVEAKIESGKPESKKSPGQILRSQSIHKTEETPVQGAPPEEGDMEGEYVPRRPLRKEPSMKRLPPRDPGPTAVPEFMRIQLNRVESKGQSVIYDTEQERNPKIERKEVEILNKKTETPLVSETIQKEVQIHEQPAENSLILKKESINILTSKESKAPTPSPVQKSNAQGSRGIFRDTSPSGNTVDSGDGDSGAEGSSSEPPVDRVVLRKPLISERTPIIERACSVTNPTPTKSRGEQPELFKVFARRSFKVKDVDKDKSESLDIDDTYVEATSEVSEVTISPVRTHSNSSPASVCIGSSLTSVSPSQLSAEGLQKPSINAISFNRKSVGNPALSFCPPPVSTSDSPANSSLSTKPVVFVLSNNSTVDTSSTEVTVTSSSRSITTITSTNGIMTSSVQSKPTTTPNQGLAAHPVQISPTPPTVSDSSVTVSTTPPSGIISKIINNRTTSITSINDTSSENENEINLATPPLISTPSKSTLSSRSGSGLFWPPRPQQDQEETLQPSQPTQIPTTLPSLINPQQKKLSLNSTSDYEGIRDSEQTEEIEVEISPLDIGAARRRFMSGGMDRSHAPVTPPTQNSLPASTSPVLGSSPSGSASNSLGNPSSIVAKTGPPVTEARNNTPSFTITVRTQAAPSTNRLDTTPVSTSIVNPNVDLNSSVTSNSSTTSIGKPEQGAAQQAAEDWRVLVRQRREGRLKQTKTPDAEEIIIETRPPVSRNSKVLEMANNFQKLQVA